MARTRWLSRAAYAGMFVFGIVMALLGAVLPLLAARLQFDLAQAGNLFLGLNSAMLASMLAAGPLMDRFGKKPALSAGALFAGAALLLIATASSYRTVVGAVFLLGLGGGALNGGTNTLISDLHTDPRRKSSALNILGIFFGFGALFLPFVIGALLEAVGLNLILYFASALAVALAAVFLGSAFPPPVLGQGLRLADAGRLARDPMVLLLGLLLFFQSGNEFIMGGFTSTFLTRELNSPISTASYLLAALWGSIMLGRLFSSRLVLWIPGPALVVASGIGAALGVAILLLASSEKMAAAGIVLVGLSFASIYPVTLGFAGARYEGRTGTVFGILFSIALVGGMTMPWAVGQIAAARGLRTALVLAAVNALIICALQMVIARRDHQPRL